MESTQSLDNIDIYEFLGVSFAASDAEIRKAGRKTSLLYHPDKVAPTPENLANFHLVQQVLAVLSDPTEKNKYDQTREAKLRRKAEVEALDARRRKMREDLEAREKNGFGSAENGLEGIGRQKRTFSQREMDIRRIQEQNRAKMAAAVAKKRAEAAAVPEVSSKDTQNGVQDAEGQQDVSGVQSDGDSTKERNIRIRWAREGLGADYDEQSIRTLLEERGYGQGIESVVLLKDKKRKIDGKKIIVGTAVIIFENSSHSQKLLSDKRKIIEFESIETMGTSSKETEA